MMFSTKQEKNKGKMLKKPRLWISRFLSQLTLDRARENFEVYLPKIDRPASKNEMVELSSKVDAFLICHSEIISSDVAKNFNKRLKIIANHSVGTDHCDLDALKSIGIVVTNTPDVLSDATAEISMLLLFGAARRAVEAQNIIKEGKWNSWSPSFMVGKQVTGQRLGIIGMGRVGQAMARNARGLNMQIHYHNRKRLPKEQEKGAVYHNSKEELLRISDFLSLHCPATLETQEIINKKTIQLMPNKAIIVNAARGKLIDEQALIDALISGKISGAGLDCFVKEPGGNPKLSALKNVFMLPHIGSATEKTRDAMGLRALENLNAYFSGKRPLDQVT